MKHNRRLLFSPVVSSFLLQTKRWKWKKQIFYGSCIARSGMIWNNAFETDYLCFFNSSANPSKHKMFLVQLLFFPMWDAERSKTDRRGRREISFSGEECSLTVFHLVPPFLALYYCRVWKSVVVAYVASSHKRAASQLSRWTEITVEIIIIIRIRNQVKIKFVFAFINIILSTLIWPTVKLPCSFSGSTKLNQ